MLPQGITIHNNIPQLIENFTPKWVLISSDGYKLVTLQNCFTHIQMECGSREFNSTIVVQARSYQERLYSDI
jgi:hypothetical protein